MSKQHIDMKQRPDVFLAAATGRKNIAIITAMSDRDQAIKNVVHSAASLLILEKKVYDGRADRTFALLP